MNRRQKNQPEMRTIVFVDSVNFTHELKTHGRGLIVPKINQLKEFTEFFFVYKLKGEFIGEMGDGFLTLCPPTPAEVINEALACQSFITAYNYGKEPPATLNTRIAIHYGLIAAPERGNYIDTNLNLTARLEGATPQNTICISSVLYDIVADVLRSFNFEELKSNFKGLGENKYYIVSSASGKTSEPTRRESRLSFYFSTIAALRGNTDWKAIRNTCEQALIDFPDNPEFTYQLASALYRLDDTIRSIRTFEQCIQMDYNVGKSLMWIGRMHSDMGNKRRAIEVLEEAAEKDPNSFHSLADIAGIYLDHGDYKEASKWAKKSLKVNPKFIYPVAILAVIALTTKQDDTLVQVLKKIEPDRYDILRKNIEKRLGQRPEPAHSRKLDLAFKAAGNVMQRGKQASS